MRLIRVHVEAALAAGARVELQGAAAEHVTRVLRLGAGDPVTLFNGDGIDYPSRINVLRKGAVEVAVLGTAAARAESPLALTLVQGIARSERMDLVVQKATELGVAAIVPVVTARSVVRLDAETRAKKLAHWRGIVIAACEQCGRNRVPEILAPVPLAHWLAQPATAGAARWLLSPRGAEPLSTIGAPGAQLELLVGPEGGLTEAEETLAVQAGYRAVLLGPRVLRTETAAPALLAALQALWGDF